MHRWVPQSIIALRHYNRHTFISDAIAGVTVGLVALPLAMAFAISSGMAPQAGIYCAIVAGFLTAALGGSMTAIGGPTGAFVVVVAGIIGQLRREWLVPMHHDGRHHPDRAWRIRCRVGRQIYSSSGRRRFYQRHRGAHREHAVERFFRAAHRSDARRLHRAHARRGVALLDDFVAGHRARHRDAS